YNMKLKLFLIAASAMALASCSSDEVVQSNESANAIQFSVVANNASRAADYYCNKSLPGDFYVSAAVNKQMYFNNEHYTKSGDTYVNAGTLRYWPNEKITFVAAKNFDENKFTFNANAANGTVFEMTVNASAKDQKDFIFGVANAERGAETPDNFNNGVATINFRHALSQIVFQAKNDNKNLFVEINQVKVCNISNFGKYTLKNETGLYDETKDTYIDHTKTSTTDPVDATVYQDGGRGTWGDHSGAAIFDTEVFTSATITGKVPGNGSTVNLTNDRGTGDHAQGGVLGTTEGYAENFSLLLLPQVITAWNATGAVMDGDNIKSGVTGAFFLVYCKIRNVAAGDGAENENDIYLWGSAGENGYEPIAVPVNNIEWIQGKKYIYTFNFTTNGHGGYDPGTGEDVLIPIEFTVTVDDFAEATGETITIDPTE
ncbi:MAG: hypothetical protein ACI30S_03120, partial [Muribaculaceae bacterium]